jgi:hypothetical protein
MTSLPGTGLADWTDYTSYWDDASATWLMDRSVPRFADFTAAAGASLSPYHVVLATTDPNGPTLGVRTNTAATGTAADFKRIDPFSQYLVPKDLSSTDVRLQLGSGSFIEFKTSPSNQVIIGPAGTVLSAPEIDTPILKADSIGSNGASSVTLTTPLSVGTLSVTGSLSVTGTSTFTGAVTAGTVNASAVNASSVTSTGAISGTNLIASGTVTGTLLGPLINPSFQIADASSSPVVNILGDQTSNRLTLRGYTVAVHAVSVPYFSYSTSGTESYLGDMAVVVYSNTDPGVTNFPSGTLWLSSPAVPTTPASPPLDVGAIADVVDGTTNVVALWGNSIRNRVVNRYATVTDRSADGGIDILTQGALSYTNDRARLELWTGSVWRPSAAGRAGAVVISNATALGTSLTELGSVTVPVSLRSMSNGLLKVSAQISIRWPANNASTWVQFAFKSDSNAPVTVFSASGIGSYAEDATYAFWYWFASGPTTLHLMGLWGGAAPAPTLAGYNATMQVEWFPDYSNA